MNRASKPGDGIIEGVTVEIAGTVVEGVGVASFIIGGGKSKSAKSYITILCVAVPISPFKLFTPVIELGPRANTA